MLFILLVFSALHIAAKQGLTPVVQDLIAKGASLTAVDNKGKFILLPYCIDYPYV
jgi:ankyrin repeat protein